MSNCGRRAILGLIALLGSGLLELPSGTSPAPPERPFDTRLKTVAKEYLAWGRVDDERRWAPELCRPPRPAEARESQSEDPKTHGQKLYSLFAKDRKGYLLSGKQANPVGQVIVKQSWVPIEVLDDGRPLNEKAVNNGRGTAGDTFVPYVRKDGKLYKAETQAELFVMMKLDPKTPDTDQGWIYATVTPDGSKATSAGKVESCMRCHAKAKDDRLFGLPGWTK